MRYTPTKILHNFSFGYAKRQVLLLIQVFANANRTVLYMGTLWILFLCCFVKRKHCIVLVSKPK